MMETSSRSCARAQVALGARRVVAVAAAVSAGVGIAALLLSAKSSILYAEGGFLETASVGVWALSFLLGLRVAIGPAPGPHRLLGLWLSVLSLLAGLRELDAQILLNPKTLGEWGVRYKINWWLDGAVPLLLKLGWALFFLGIAALLLLPPFRARREIARQVASLDLRVLLLGAASVFLAMGFVIDDLMRGSTWVGLETRQLLEETSELIGAVLFCLSAVLHWGTPSPGPQAGKPLPG